MMFTELQNRFNSVDRIAEYTSRIEHEPKWECEQDQKQLLNWPSEGNPFIRAIIALCNNIVGFFQCYLCVLYLVSQ